MTEIAAHIDRPAAPPRYDSEAADYWALLKPKVMVLVVFTGAAGMLAAPGTLHPLLAAITLLCIGAGAGAAGALNCYIERHRDALMARTAGRPLPQGRIAPDDALVFGIGLSLAAVAFLGLAVNWQAAGLLAAGNLFYVLIYTLWLKPRTPQNIVIGGAAGAFPPLIGWVATAGELAWTPWALFGLIFLWTPPHFWALALDRNADYRRAGIPMLPVVAGVRATTRQMIAYTALLTPVALLPWLLGDAGLVYAGGSVLLSLVFLAAAIQVHRDPSRKQALRLFGFSILYLFMVFGLLMIDATHGPLRAWIAP